MASQGAAQAGWTPRWGALAGGRRRASPPRTRAARRIGRRLMRRARTGRGPPGADPTAVGIAVAASRTTPIERGGGRGGRRRRGTAIARGAPREGAPRDRCRDRLDIPRGARALAGAPESTRGHRGRGVSRRHDRPGGNPARNHRQTTRRGRHEHHGGAHPPGAVRADETRVHVLAAPRR